MNANVNIRLTLSRLVLGLGTLALAAVAPAQTSTMTTPGTAWQPYGQMITLSASHKGSADLGHYTVPRQDQEMRTDLFLSVFKNAVPVGQYGDGYDYYLVTGQYRHSVKGYGSNSYSLGYYATSMGLSLSGNGATLVDFGPASTVGENTTSWSVGGSLSAGGSPEGPTGGGSVSFSYGSSFSSPNVTFSTTTGADSVTFVTKLPGEKGDPKPPSKSGYQYYLAAIFRVPQGQSLKLSVGSTASWRYEYTRLIVNDTITLLKTGTFNVAFNNRPILSATGTNRCLGVSGTVPALSTCTGGTDQQWSYTKDSQVQNTALQLCLDGNPISTGGTAEMILTACDPSKLSQKFRLGTSSDKELFPGIYALNGNEVTTQSTLPAPMMYLLPPTTDFQNNFTMGFGTYNYGGQFWTVN